MNFSRATASSVSIDGFDFSGPFTSTKYLEPRPGVFAILDLAADDSWTLLDVDVLENLRDGIGKHARWPDWMKAARGRVAVAGLCPAFWKAEDGRAIADRIRRQHNPPLGLLPAAPN